MNSWAATATAAGRLSLKARRTVNVVRNSQGSSAESPLTARGAASSLGPCIDHLRCPAYLLELRIARPGLPLLGELPVDRMVHGSDEFQEDDRTAAFEAGGQLDPRQPPIARRTRGTGPRMPNMPRQTDTPSRRGFPPGTAAQPPSRPPRMAPSPLWLARPGPGDEIETPRAGREWEEDLHSVQALRHRTGTPPGDTPDFSRPPCTIDARPPGTADCRLCYHVT